MTLVIAWVRKIEHCEELVFVSDSRLSGDGRTFDACPKIISLPRTDCAIAFAGYTGHAFPMMLQLALAIDSYEPARRGSVDISSLRKHALKVFDIMSKMIHSSPMLSINLDEHPEANFLFGGYSWVKKRFELWTMSYSTSEHRFEAQPGEWLAYSEQAKKCVFRKAKSPQGTGPYSKIAFAGDQAQKARQCLLSKFDAKLSKKAFKGIDWEPFEVLRDMLRDPNHSETIGGAPQVIKVYQYMRTASLGVFWPDRKSQKVFLQGRPCLDYENIDRWILDPDTLSSESPIFSKNDEEFLSAVDPEASKTMGE